MHMHVPSMRFSLTHHQALHPVNLYSCVNTSEVYGSPFPEPFCANVDWMLCSHLFGALSSISVITFASFMGWFTWVLEIVMKLNNLFFLFVAFVSY